MQADQGRGAKGGRGPAVRGGGETALTDETKTKVEAAVKAKYPGATIVRTETNSDSTAPYESHITTSAGTELEVLVSKSFEVVDAREHPRARSRTSDLQARRLMRRAAGRSSRLPERVETASDLKCWPRSCHAAAALP